MGESELYVICRRNALQMAFRLSPAYTGIKCIEKKRICFIMCTDKFWVDLHKADCIFILRWQFYKPFLISRWSTKYSNSRKWLFRALRIHIFNMTIVSKSAGDDLMIEWWSDDWDGHSNTYSSFNSLTFFRKNSQLPRQSEWSNSMLW